MKTKFKTRIMASFFTLAVAIVFCSTAASQQPPPATEKLKEITGTNPQGDRIEWEDGEVWTNVTLKVITRGSKDGKPIYTLEFLDVPAGSKSGEMTRAFRAIRLRGSAPVTETPSKSLHFQKSRDQMGKSPLGTLPPLDAAASWNDMCACEWLDEWDSRVVQPENSMQLEAKNGKKLYLQTGVTIPVIVIKDGEMHSYLRNTGGNAGVAEAWFTGMEMIFFGREVPSKQKLEPKK